VRRVSLILLAALGRPRWHGCWTGAKIALEKAPSAHSKDSKNSGKGDAALWPPLGKGMALGGVGKKEKLPKFDYYIDESDPDIIVLRRQDGSFAAAFSARGATREGMVEAAREDYGRVIEAYADSLDLREEDDRQRSA
jgi:hypothetical protein